MEKFIKVTTYLSVGDRISNPELTAEQLAAMIESKIRSEYDAEGVVSLKLIEVAIVRARVKSQ